MKFNLNRLTTTPPLRGAGPLAVPCTGRRSWGQAVGIALLVSSWSFGAQATVVWQADVFSDGAGGVNVPGVGFSLIHQTTTPSGSTIYQFEDTPSFELAIDLQNPGAFATGDLISSTANAPLLNVSHGGELGTFTIENLQLSIGDPRGAGPGAGTLDGTLFSSGEQFFAVGGSIQYSIDGFSDANDNIAGTFEFDAGLDMRVFNKAAFNATDGSWTAWVWGADFGNGIGIDLALSGQAPPQTLDESPALVLFGIGLLGFGVAAGTRGAGTMK